ncbi:ATP-binding protein [Labrys sp. ZIDIC5]|uniref:ATP-binding protein n=1 Tax=Labrys sedimenti TaxID=3106036 RepID=UPI002ACA9F4D|nr:winged helix-turn-helix domain-containing protein [Labrys sp. ZIDIC5]MDZ5453391.1 winged helix-turn-helix domain-containing protein [Labrys sp. ZIDIC5]
MDEAAERLKPELVFSFGPYRLIPSRQLLLLEDHPVKLGGRGFELLRLLVHRGGELVSKEELMAAAWPGIFVHESNLKVNMSNLRRLLGDTKLNPSYLATVVGRGYRFIAPVQAGIGAFEEGDAFAESSGLGHLPPQEHIVGREAELADVLSALHRERHVTLVGAGGIGKTTVAIAAARAYADVCFDGLCLVDLSTIDDATLLPVALVTALGIRGNPDDSFAAILDYLLSRRMLVILDNCEHVLPAATIFARSLASKKGLSKILATSREPLNFDVEFLIRIGPLAVPDGKPGLPLQRAISFPTVELFASRALQWAGYQISDADCDAVVSICRSVDGLPLAIELMAAQLENYSPLELLAMFDRHTSFSNLRLDGVTPRHETLLATIDWSYRLLSQREAAIFRLVSVFADFFELEDAVHVARAVDLDPIDVVAGLGGLVAKSLLNAEVNGPGLRYRQLASTRHYAAEKRRTDNADALILKYHAQRVLDLFKRSEDEWHWLEKGDWTTRYVSRLADLRAALAWAFGADGDIALGIGLTVAAIPLWSETSILSEAQERTEVALKLAESVPCDGLLKAKLACSRAWSLYYSKMRKEIEDAWLRAIGFAQRAHSLEYEQRGLEGLAYYQMEVGKIDEAISCLEASERLSARHRDWSAAPEGDRALAWAKAHRGDFVESGKVLDRLAVQHSFAGKRTAMAGQDIIRFVSVRCYLTFIAWMTGRADYANVVTRDAVEQAGRAGHWLSQSNALGLAALPLALETGNIALLEHYSVLMQRNMEREIIPRWIPVHHYFKGTLSYLKGDGEAYREVRDAIEHMIECRYLLRIGMYIAGLARVLLHRGLLNEAADTISLAFRYQERQGERWCRSELIRIDAAIRHRAGNHAAAERMWKDAVEEAHAIGAKSFELRAASDLAAHYIDTCRSGEAMALLAPLYRGFSEGFDTQDLRTATQLLHSASSPAGALLQ